MLSPRMDLIDPHLKSELQSSMRDMMDDAEQKVSITYSSLTSIAYNTDTGKSTRTETDDTVNAIRHIVTASELQAGDGSPYQAGDRIYVVDAADLTNTPNAEDRITDAGETLQVTRVEGDVLEHLYTIIAVVV